MGPAATLPQMNQHHRRLRVPANRRRKDTECRLTEGESHDDSDDRPARIARSTAWWLNGSRTGGDRPRVVFVPRGSGFGLRGRRRTDGAGSVYVLSDTAS